MMSTARSSRGSGNSRLSAMNLDISVSPTPRLAASALSPPTISEAALSSLTVVALMPGKTSTRHFWIGPEENKALGLTVATAIGQIGRLDRRRSIRGASGRRRFTRLGSAGVVEDQLYRLEKGV